MTEQHASQDWLDLSGKVFAVTGAALQHSPRRGKGIDWRCG
ncbi:hypothetical protein [Kluyvera sp. CHPC 1.251]